MESLPAREPLLARLGSGAWVAVIRLRSLGDCVLTTPALGLLKAYRPDLRIRVVVEPRFAGVFEGHPDIEEISPEVGRRVDMVLNLHGGSRSMWMTLASGARFRVGFGHHRYSWIYSHKIPRAQEILGDERPVHTAEHLASAMFWLGVPRTEIPRARLIAGEQPAYLPYVVMHPFGATVEKTWPRERFIEVAGRLQSAGLEPMILGGPGDDASAFAQFQVFRNAPLGDVKNLMSGASLFIGNDSGPAHIAAAFGVPVVALFGPSNPVTWAPWRAEARVLTSRGDIGQITIDDVMAAAETLRGARARA